MINNCYTQAKTSALYSEAIFHYGHSVTDYLKVQLVTIRKINIFR